MNIHHNLNQTKRLGKYALPPPPLKIDDPTPSCSGLHLKSSSPAPVQTPKMYKKMINDESSGSSEADGDTDVFIFDGDGNTKKVTAKQVWGEFFKSNLQRRADECKMYSCTPLKFLLQYFRQ